MNPAATGTREASAPVPEMPLEADHPETPAAAANHLRSPHVRRHAPLIWIHFLASLVALPLGLTQLLAAKGTPVHRRLGRFYVPIMLIALVTALASFQPGTPFLFFYILALVGLGSLGSGMLNLRRWLKGGNPAHLRGHKIDMAFSWLGLFMAAVSQVLVNPRFGIADFTTGWTYWGIFALINILIYAAGSWWIFHRLIVEPVRQQRD